MKKRYPLLLATFLASQAQAVELETQQVSGQLFNQAIAEQAFAVETLTREEISQMPVQSLADVLEWVAGIDVRQRGGFDSQTDVGIRGAGYEQTLILLDGIRQNHPQTGHHTFDIPIALEDIERIEVVRGPGAGQYGPNGNAGVINFVTRKKVDADNGRNAQLNLSGGSFGYGRGALALAKTEGTISQFANATYQRSDSYIPNANLGTDMKQGNYRVVRDTQNDTTVFSVNYMAKEFGAQGFYGPASYWGKEETEQWYSYLTHEHRFNNEQSMDVALSYHNHHDNFWFGAPSATPSNHWVDSYQARIRFNANRFISLGYEFNQEEVNSNTMLLSKKHERNYQSLFSYGHYDFSFLQLSGSLSYLDYKDGDSYVLPVLGVVVPVGQHHIYANAGQSVRVPTLNDLYLNQGKNVGNPTLKSEKTDSVELGTRLNLAGVQTRLAVFARDTTNAIDFTQTAAEVAAGSEVYTSRNIDKIETKGVDVELDGSALLAEYGFNKAVLSYTHLSQDLSNSYAKAKYTKEQLEHQTVLNLGYRITHNLSVSSLYKYESRYDQQDYFVWDLGLKQKFEHWHWGLAAENILNEKYIDSGFIRAPGTIARFDLGLEF
ncbi:MAG: TonB-dependent receptor [Venatoribacter sp.]